MLCAWYFTRSSEAKFISHHSVLGWAISLSVSSSSQFFFDMSFILIRASGAVFISVIALVHSMFRLGSSRSCVLRVSVSWSTAVFASCCSSTFLQFFTNIYEAVCRPTRFPGKTISRNCSSFSASWVWATILCFFPWLGGADWKLLDSLDYLFQQPPGSDFFLSGISVCLLCVW